VDFVEKQCPLAIIGLIVKFKNTSLHKNCWMPLHHKLTKLHRFIQISHEFHAMVNMNDIFTYLISKIFKQMKHYFWMTYANVHV
jgi:hypothetical protein